VFPMAAGAATGYEDFFCVFRGFQFFWKEEIDSLYISIGYRCPHSQTDLPIDDYILLLLLERKIDLISRPK
jgi:hypothetical protein